MFGKTLFIAAAFAAVTLAAECPGSELLKLTPIATNPNVATCTKDSGFNLIPPTGLPTEAQTAKMCKSTACVDLLKAIKAQGPSDCDLTIIGVTINVGKLVGSFDSDCARLTAATTSAIQTTSTPAAASTPVAAEAASPVATAAAAGPEPTKEQC